MKPITLTQKAFLACLISMGWVPLLAADEIKAAPTSKTSNYNAPSLELHLLPEWLNGAERIQTSLWTVYYKGTAEGAYSEDKTQWVGKITGDILALSAANAIVLPEGTLTVKEDGKFGTTGLAKRVMATPTDVKWKHLLKTNQ